MPHNICDLVKVQRLLAGAAVSILKRLKKCLALLPLAIEDQLAKEVHLGSCSYSDNYE